MKHLDGLIESHDYGWYADISIDDKRAVTGVKVKSLALDVVGIYERDDLSPEQLADADEWVKRTEVDLAADNSKFGTDLHVTDYDGILYYNQET